MNLVYDEIKTTQVAALLLKSEGGAMNYMKLLKLMYFIEREAIFRWNRPITCDRIYSMENGMVLSHTYNLINEGVPPGTDSCWLEHIKKSAYEVNLQKDITDNKLSTMEIGLVSEIYKKYGAFDQWDLRDKHHLLPEWNSEAETQKTSIKAEYQDILKALGKTDSEIVTILAELEHLEFTQVLFGK